MLVDELSIKITAEADKFKQEIDSAKTSLAQLRDHAIKAGEEVTAAFEGMITAKITAEGASRTATAVSSNGDAKRFGGLPTTDIGIAAVTNYTHTATVPTLEKNETVIGAVANAASETQTVNLTTTVELDGDKVGESVNRFNMRRNVITNGLYR